MEEMDFHSSRTPSVPIPIRERGEIQIAIQKQQSFSEELFKNNVEVKGIKKTIEKRGC
ncbi:hypothetical protein [Rossellomorea vietnamensis]|uniref:hypothetical protein n=1 Tax=Rossellomorea vietnamensis TaxID=218284 RepID=UPI001653ACFB|nr:hypothetical protein [Rossellomorea vietnamensis]